MKKKVSRAKSTKSTKVKKAAPKVAKRSSRRSSSYATQTMLIPVTVRRFFLITTCLVLAVVAVFAFNKKPVTQSVAGVSVARGLFNQTTVTIPQVPGAVSYNIYYKQTSENTYTNAVRKIPANVSSYTISYLKKGVSYQYRVSAAYSNGKEFWWSDVANFTNLQSM